MAKMSGIDYLMFKIRGRIVKVDPDIYYKIRNPGHELPCKKYNGDIVSVYLSMAGYPVIVYGEKPPQRHIPLSRFVMNAKEGEIVDHKNRSPLDNRRKNLRIVNKRQNCLNRICKNASGYIGVSIKNRKGRKYCSAKFQLKGGKQRSFQLPDNPHNRVICAFARDKFVLAAGEEDYAPLNFECFKNEPFRSFLLGEDLRSRRS
jgi:hypothetical protein